MTHDGTENGDGATGRVECFMVPLSISAPPCLSTSCQSGFASAFIGQLSTDPRLYTRLLVNGSQNGGAPPGVCNRRHQVVIGENALGAV
jgi:hypothetical protein